MKKSILTILSLSMALFSFAQTYKGIVKDSKGETVSFANVVLYSLPDSTFVAGTTTNNKGEFLLRIEQGVNGYLSVSFIGYETQTIPAAENIGTVILKEKTNELGEVVVKGRLPQMQIKGDAFVTTIQNSVLAKAGSGDDVLKRLPMLTGDNGVFKVFGKGEAKIYINNRALRDKSELENLNSDDIKNVEIVTNPGAKYDASVKAVIRIYTIKRLGDGLSFDVRSSYFQGENTDLVEKVSMNYRKKGWDVFGMFKFNRNRYFQDSELWQKTYVDTLWTQKNTLYSEGGGDTYTAMGGVNYEILPKHYVGMKYTLTLFPQSTATSQLNSTVDADGVLYDKWSNNETSINKNKPSHYANVYYNGVLGDLNVDFNTDYYSSQNSSVSTAIETSDNFDDRRVDAENRVKNRLLASKLVFSHPFAGGKVSAGSEYANTHRKDEYSNAQKIVPASNTTFHEHNIAFFAEYSRMTSIGQLNAGLRYENVHSDYFSNGTRIADQSRSYSQWFPNISFGTKIKNVGLQLSYTAKTKRPTYRQLRSNVHYGNRFLLQTGNPFLKPTIIHDVTLVGAWQFVQLMVSYKDERDAVIYWTEQDENNPAISILAFRNLEKMPSLSVFASLTPTIGIWSPQLSAGIIKQWVTIMSAGKSVKLNKPLPIVSLNNSFRLPKNFIFTLDAQYMGEGDTQNVYLIKNNMVVNASISKSFFNDRLNISLKGHDLFSENKDGNQLYNAQMELYQMNRYDSRELEITVRYKFNTVKSKYKGKGAGKSEIDRMSN